MRPAPNGTAGECCWCVASRSHTLASATDLEGATVQQFTRDQLTPPEARGFPDAGGAGLPPRGSGSQPARYGAPPTFFPTACAFRVVQPAGEAGVRPWRRMISPSIARSGGPSPKEANAAAISSK
jgi:hypothetical protein